VAPGDSQQLPALQLQLLELQLLAPEGLQAGQQGGRVAGLQRLVFGLQLVPAGLEALQVSSVGVDTAGGVTAHHLHLGEEQGERE